MLLSSIIEKTSILLIVVSFHISLGEDTDADPDADFNVD
jgi:hypothetical protein